MKLFHLITTLDIGGAENHLLALLSGLPRPEFEIRVGYLKGAGGLRGRFEEQGVAVTDFALRHAADATVLRRLAAAFAGSDVVHTHLFKADVFGAAAAKIAGVPRLVSSKHNEDQYLKDFGAGLIGRMAARAADRVICISRAVHGFMAARKLPQDRLVVIPYGMDAPPADPSRRDAIRREFGAGPDDLVIGTMGRLEEQKGQSDLIDAMAHLPSARLVLVGRGSLDAPLRARAAPLGPRVHFAGFRTDVAAVMAAFDIFALPSRWEGFGLVLLEAMAQGLPIVGSAAGSIPEIVVEGETGLLVPPGDAAALGRALASLAADPARARSLGAAGRRRLDTVYGLRRMIDAYTRLYRELAP